MEMTVAQVVEKYMAETGLTLRAFAEALTESVQTDLTHSSVYFWKTGQVEPNTDFLILLLLHYRDWRFDFALECLEAKKPDVWGPAGRIWNVRKEVNK